MSPFHGTRYWYPTPDDLLRHIGVCQVLGGAWAVCWVKENGARVRVKSSNLPVLADPDAAQRRLDEWAVKRGLEVV